MNLIFDNIYTKLTDFDNIITIMTITTKRAPYIWYTAFVRPINDAHTPVSAWTDATQEASCENETLLLILSPPPPKFKLRICWFGWWVVVFY
jgi:hypothetical protein